MLAGSAIAQTPVVEWATPVNLSQAGDATHPQLTLTDDGNVYVIWENVDETSSMLWGQSGQWAEPVRMELPFSGLNYQWVADNAGYLHVVWLDDDSVLLHQRVSAANVDNSAAWSNERQLATGVAAFDIAVDNQNRVHVAYLRAEDTLDAPAGIYSVSSDRAAETWLAPIGIYASRYFRSFVVTRQSLTAPAETAHVTVETSAGEGTASTSVYITWDNPALKQVFLARSRTAGQTWEAPVEIVGPKRDTPYTTPRQIRLHAQAQQLLLFWQASEAGGSCTQLFQASTDDGETWGDPQPLLAEFARCPEAFQTITPAEDLTLLAATIYNQLYLLAWDGERWSQPQPQPTLSSFINPATFNYVEYGCRQMGFANDQLLVVGCDVSGGGDIWATTRALGPVAEWFSPAPSWATHIITATAPVRINSLALASDALSTVQVLWSQARTESATNAADIYHVRWSQDEVVGPFAVLSRLSGVVNHLTLATDPDDRLLAFWSGGTTGALTFSWANARQASLDTSWASPQLILEAESLGQSPRVMIEDEDTLYLAYVIPLNEQRGVYVTRSADSGNSWSDAVQVFDAVAEGCELVEQPRLAVTRRESLHVVWVCSTLPGGVGPLALYYSRSEDGGLTWAPAQIIAAQSVPWAEILSSSSSDQTLHIVWEQVQAGRAGQLHRMSFDDGQTWTDSRALPLVEGLSGPASLAADPAGQLHLLQLVQESAASPLLRYTIWDGQTWTVGESWPTSIQRLEDVVALVSTVDASGRLVAAYADSHSTGDPGLWENAIVLAVRPIDLPEVRVTPGQTPDAATPEPLPTPSATPAVSATAMPSLATPTLSAFNVANDPPPGDNSTLGLVIGVVAALGFIGAILFVRRRFFSGGQALN